MTSRQPFRDIKQSPWENEGAINEKALTDNLRVVVNPRTAHRAMEQTTKDTKATFALRTSQAPLKTGSRMSAWGLDGEDIDQDPKMTLHHSEISIFQQLCLDKIDENAAIEILLDSTEKDTPEIYTESSEGSDHDSNSLSKKKTGSVDGKRKFLNRLFSKPQRKSPIEPFSSNAFWASFKENNHPISHSPEMSDEPTIPTPPSSIPRTRITVESNNFPNTSDIAWKAYNEGSTAKKTTQSLSSTTRKDIETSTSTVGTHVEKSTSTTGNLLESSMSTTGKHVEGSRPTIGNQIERSKSIQRSRSTTGNHFERSKSIQRSRSITENRIERSASIQRSWSTTGSEIERSKSIQRSRSTTGSQIERSKSIQRWRSTTGNQIERSRSSSGTDFERSRSTARSRFERSNSMFDGGDTISNLTSLSGTRASSLLTPVNFNRHESLGFESIRDIRKCLKEMERQLGQATDKGQRVSREKVMRALFTVADSLEDDEEKSHLRKELETSRETRNDELLQQTSSKPMKKDHSHDYRSEGTSSDEDDFTLDSDSDTFEDDDADDETDESPFNIVSSVGNFLGVNTKEQQAVEEVLDDLLWTEFVSQRQKNAKKKKKSSSTYSRTKSYSNKGKTRSGRNRRSSVETKKYKEPHAKKERSWWRKYPSKEEEEEEFSTSSSEDDEYSTSSSSTDEFKSYLPTSITVKKRSKKPAKLEECFPRSMSNPRYKVKLVDTESRLGYEMDHVPRRSPVM